MYENTSLGCENPDFCMTVSVRNLELGSAIDILFNFGWEKKQTAWLLGSQMIYIAMA